MDSKIYDVIIVGSGPGGSSLAARLAEAGLHVLILDKQKSPRDKVCGGKVTKRALMKMPMDITPIIRDQITSFVTVEGNHDIQEFKYETPFIYTVLRTELDQLLVRHAVNCGSDLIEDALVKKVVQRKDRVDVWTRGEHYSGKYLVGADGFSNTVAMKVGLVSAPRKALALEYEFRCDQTINAEYKSKAVIDYTSVPGGYIWILPRNGILSTGISSYSLNQKQMSQYLLSFLDHREVNGILLSAKGSASLAASEISQSIMTKRTALIGDAAGLVDSFTGEDIYYALWSAELLSARFIEVFKNGQDTFPNYQDDVNEVILPELKLLDQFGRDFYKDPKFMRKIVFHFPELLDMFFDVLEGKGDYNQLYMRFNEVKQLGKIFYRNPSSQGI
jgi:geranylgeranyl reductase family